ncbi:MAG: hypothetical protein ABII85_01820 [Bacillota bacterium]
MTITEFVTGNINKIAYAVGFDVSDTDSKAMIQLLIEAGIDDMKQSGVAEAVITTNKLSIVALIQFTMDNLKMVPGDFRTSPMYQSNVMKLKYAVIPDAS